MTELGKVFLHMYLVCVGYGSYRPGIEYWKRQMIQWCVRGRARQKNAIVSFHDVWSGKKLELLWRFPLLFSTT